MTRFASDEELSYRRDALRLEPGHPLRLDSAYCQNQLPLVDPDHPDVAGPGRYAEARVSLVVVVPLAEFAASPSYRSLDARLRRSRLAGKLAWDLLERRSERRHATVCSRLNARLTAEEIRRRLDRLRGFPAFRIRVRGPWLSGRFNRGRLYLPVYPEVDGGLDALGRIQREAGWTATGFYGTGFHNLVDHLAEPETGRAPGDRRRVPGGRPPRAPGPPAVPDRHPRRSPARQPGDPGPAAGPAPVATAR